jgi:hypothetical protein
VFRRQSLGKTRKQLRSALGYEDRERVMDWWSLAEDLFTTSRGEPSALASYLATISALGLDAASVAKVPPAVFLIAMRTGYALRMCLDIFAYPEPLDIATIDKDRVVAIARGSVNSETGLLDVSDTESDLLQPVIELVSEVAFDRFGEVGSVAPDFWSACMSLACYQLQKNIQQQGLGFRGKRLDPEISESSHRFGFVLRCLDEALEIEPDDPGGDWEDEEQALRPATGATERRPQDLPPHLSNRPQPGMAESTGREDLAAAILDRAVIVHTNSMSDQAEQSIAAGPLMVLGEEAWSSWNEPSRDAAIVLCRMGFVVRLTELEMVPEARNPDHPGWAGIGEVILRETEQATADADAAFPSISAAWFMATDPRATEAVLYLVPGASSVVRTDVISRWLDRCDEGGMVPSDTTREDRRKLTVYGYALAVVREFTFTAQERGDAEREGRPPSY